MKDQFRIKRKVNSFAIPKRRHFRRTETVKRRNKIYREQRGAKNQPRQTPPKQEAKATQRKPPSLRAHHHPMSRRRLRIGHTDFQEEAKKNPAYRRFVKPTSSLTRGVSITRNRLSSRRSLLFRRQSRSCPRAASLPQLARDPS
jgi:hypothetical protein